MRCAGSRAVTGTLLDVFGQESLPPDSGIRTTPNLLAASHVSANALKPTTPSIWQSSFNTCT